VLSLVIDLLKKAFPLQEQKQEKSE